MAKSKHCAAHPAARHVGTATTSSDTIRETTLKPTNNIRAHGKHAQARHLAEIEGRRGFIRDSAIFGTMLGTCCGAALAREAQTLKISHFLPETSTMHTDVLEPFAQALAGIDPSVSVRLYPRAELSRTSGLEIDTLIRGVSDIAFLVGFGAHQAFNALSVITRPLRFASIRDASAVFQRMIDQGVFDVHPDVKILAGSTIGDFLLHLKDPVASVRDIQGRRLHCSAFHTDAVRALGAKPILVRDPAETRDALAQNTIDGFVQNWPGVMIWKLADGVRQHVAVDLGQLPSLVAMNRVRFTSLSESMRRAIVTNSGASLAARMVQALETGASRSRQAALKQSGAPVLTLSRDDRAWLEPRIAQATEHWRQTQPDGAALLAALHEATKAVNVKT